MSSAHETPAIPDGQPNPVIVGPGMKTLGDDAYTKASNATPSVDTDKKHPLFSDGPSYFSDTPGVHRKSPPDGDSDVTTPATPEQAAKQARSGRELLRRLSLVGTSPQAVPEIDPCEQHPGLRLSGRIISATFCIPYKLYFQSGSDWVCFTSLISDKIALRLTSQFVSIGAQIPSRNVRFV